MANINYLKSGDNFVPDIQLSVVGDTLLGKFLNQKIELHDYVFVDYNNNKEHNIFQWQCVYVICFS